MLFKCIRIRSLPIIAAVIVFSMLLVSSVGGNAAIQTSSQAVEATPLPVIMYHQITDDSSKTSKFIVSTEQLETDFKHIKEHGYTAITAEELYNYLSHGKPLPQKPIIITFDDGCESFLSYALPLLEKYDLKAVMSVVGSFADKFTKTPDHNLRYSCLDWSEINQLVQSGRVEIANHTYDMHSNSNGRKGAAKKSGESEQSYRAELMQDVGHMQQLLLNNTGRTAVTFTFPYGAMSKGSRSIIGEMGFNVILTCEERVNMIPSSGDYRSCLMGLGRYNRSGKYSTEGFFAKFEQS